MAELLLAVAGAVLAAALTQIGLIVAMQSGPHQDMFVIELQLLMASITTTGLLLGVTVDERARKDAELRSSLRLAAAGQMSAALAHELSQPLTALATYAQTCEMLAGDAAPQTPERRDMLIDVTRKISADSKRAWRRCSSCRLCLASRTSDAVAASAGDASSEFRLAASSCSAWSADRGCTRSTA